MGKHWPTLEEAKVKESKGKQGSEAAPSLKVKKDFQRIYEFEAQPERQTKPSIYIC